MKWQWKRVFNLLGRNASFDRLKMVNIKRKQTMGMAFQRIIPIVRLWNEQSQRVNCCVRGRERKWRMGTKVVNVVAWVSSHQQRTRLTVMMFVTSKQSVRKEYSFLSQKKGGGLFKRKSGEGIWRVMQVFRSRADFDKNACAFVW